MTIALGVLAVACASALVFFHLPLPWDSDDPLVLPPIYLFGVWLSIVLAIGVTSLYAFQVDRGGAQTFRCAGRDRTGADARAASDPDRRPCRRRRARTRHAAVDDLPDFARAGKDGRWQTSPLAADLKTLREQAQRCRDILAKITQLSSSGAPFDRMPLSTLIEETVAPHRDFGVAIKVRHRGRSARASRSATRNPAILYGVGNILENAVDFARTTVEVNAWWNADTVEIVISDDGPGIAPDMLKRIGEPYLSRRRSTDEAQSERAGLGLGVFIARTLLERTGAKVSFSNRTFPDHGAVVQIAWPRDRFEAERKSAEPAS